VLFYREKLEREVRVERYKGAVLRQPYLWRPLLDEAKIWLCCAPHYFLHYDRRDRSKLLPFKKSDHLKFSRNPFRPVRVAGRFLLVLPFD